MNSPTRRGRKMDSVSIRVPYERLNRHEVELVGVHGRPDPSVHGKIPNGNDREDPAPSPSPSPSPSSAADQGNADRKTLILGSMVAAGVQFGWALQLSLLTPYIQTLGIEHAFSSFIWLCGPITGLVVQPCVGIWSDKCQSKYGRRRPFILTGAVMISVAVTIIGFSADLGYVLGDTKENCKYFKGTRTWAAIVFVIGFWMLDLANNTVQGPARALLADLSGPDQKNLANAIFCSWMALGNVLGFSAGASGNWHRWFPFLTTKACCDACGNLKAAFLVAVVYLIFCTVTTLYFAKEVQFLEQKAPSTSDSTALLNDSNQADFQISTSSSSGFITKKSAEGCSNGKQQNTLALNTGDDMNEDYKDGPGAVMVNLLTSLRHLPPGMHSVLIVMALSWLSWFPFFLFDTDWMGREVYHGDPKISTEVYDKGVREGAFGLLLNSVVLGISSFFIQPMCQRMGSKTVWAISNFMVFVCMAGTAIISVYSMGEYSKGIEHVIGVSGPVKIAALVVFALLGFPLAITYSVPFSVTAELTADAGGGQGLAIGVLNLAIVVPQMIVSLGAGPWDALFGGGNIPAFVLATVFALAAGIVAIRYLPNLSNNSHQSSGFHGFG